MKKKLLAIFVAIVMVVSAVAVLAACDKNNEYTVTFSNINGQTYFTLQTKDGKLSKEDVDAKTATISNGDMTFMGWYASTDYDQATDSITYNDPIDYDTVYDNDDAEYYAYWFGGSGSANGYTVVGVIGDEPECWDEVPENHDSWILQQDSTKKWLYSVTLDLKAGNNFKVKEIAPGWNPEFGYSMIAEVTIADGANVTLPDGTTAADLFGTVGLGNIGISDLVETMNLTIIYDHSIGKLKLVINSATLLAEIPEFDWMIVGTLAEGEWVLETENPKLMFTKTEEKYVQTLEYTFRAGDMWKIKKNSGAWDGDFGGGAIKSITPDTGVTLPEEKMFTGDGDIETTFACTVVITLNQIKGTIDIVVKSYTAGTWEENGYVLIGSFQSYNPGTTDTQYKFVRDGQKHQGSLDWSFTAGDAFKIASNLTPDETWSNITTNLGWNNKLVIVDTNGDAVANLFADDHGNIGVRANCTVTLTYNARIGVLTIVVKTHDDIPPVVNDERWILGGNMNGWPTGGDYTGDEKYILTATSDNDKILTVTVDLAVGNEFKIKQAYTWDNAKGIGAITGKVTAEDGITIDGIFDGTDNIVVKVACNVTITLNTETGEVTVHINSLAAAE